MKHQKISYVNHLGVKKSKVFSFELNSMEVTKLQVEYLEGMPLVEGLQKLSDSGNIVKLNNFIRALLLESFGIVSADGEIFDKSPEARKTFEYSPAFHKLYGKLLSDTDFQAKFFPYIMHGATAEDSEKIKKMMREENLKEGVINIQKVREELETHHPEIVELPGTADEDEI